MQVTETLLILYGIVNLIYFLIGKKAKRPFAYVGLGLIIIHLLLGEARWQMAAGYLVISVIIATQLFQRSAKKWIRVISSVAGLLLIALSGALCYTLPVFTLPAPIGSYAVASQSLYLKDDSRKEDITTDPSDVRELMVDVFYPVNGPVGNTLPYLKPEERLGFAMKYDLPPSAFSYLNQVKTHVLQNASPAEGAFPVLIFSPGYYTPASGYHSIIAEMVSHGFVVFSINHSYETMASHFPDGREIFFDQAYANQYNWSDAMGKAVNQFDIATEAEKYEAIKAVNIANVGANLSVERWSTDISAVIDAMQEWNQDSSFPLTGQLKLDQIGAFGHSRGGASAINASLTDQRIKATANLDGAQWGKVIQSKMSRPTAVISSARSTLYEVNKYIYHEAKGADFYDVVLANSGHSNFSDIPYMVRIPQLNEAGSILPERATASFNGFILAFFQKHLEGKTADLSKVVASDGNLSWKE